MLRGGVVRTLHLTDWGLLPIILEGYAQQFLGGHSQLLEVAVMPAVDATPLLLKLEGEGSHRESVKRCTKITSQPYGEDTILRYRRKSNTDGTDSF